MHTSLKKGIAFLVSLLMLLQALPVSVAFGEGTGVSAPIGGFTVSPDAEQDKQVDVTLVFDDGKEPGTGKMTVGQVEAKNAPAVENYNFTGAFVNNAEIVEIGLDDTAEPAEVYVTYPDYFGAVKLNEDEKISARYAKIPEPKAHLTVSVASKIEHADPAADTEIAAGDTVHYQIIVKNDGSKDLEKNLQLKYLFGALEEGKAFDGTEEGTSDLGEAFGLSAGSSYIVTALDYVVKPEDTDGTNKEITLNVTVDGKTKTLDGEEVPVEVEPAVYTLVTTEAHITINKNVISEPSNGEAYDKGEAVQYQIQVFNDGTKTLNLTISDAQFPADASELTIQKNHQTLKADEYALDAEKHTVTYDGFAPLDQLSIIYTAAVPDDADKEYKNEISVTAVNADDPEKTVEVPDEASVPVTSRDLSSTVTVSKPVVKAGDTEEYTVTVENKGNVTERAVSVVKNIPGMVYVSGQITEGENARAVTAEEVSESGNTLTIANIAPGAKYELKYTYQVAEADIPAAQAAALKKPVKVNGADVEAAVDTAGIAISVQSPSGEFKEGEQITFTATVTNTGTANLANVALTFEKSTTGLAGNVSPGSSRITSLRAGASIRATFAYTVQGSDWSTNGTKTAVFTASASGKAGTVDVSASAQGSAVIAQKVIGLESSLTVNKESQVNAGDVLVYTLYLRNTGNATLRNLKINPTMNNGRRAVRGVPSSTGSVTIGSATDSEIVIASFAPGATLTLEYTYSAVAADVLAGTPITFTATITPSEGGVQTRAVSSTVAKVSMTLDVEEISRPDNTEGYIAGEVVTFKVTLVNTGDAQINGLNVTHSFNGGASVSDMTGTVLNVNATNSFNITYTVTAEDVARGRITIVVTASAETVNAISDSAEVKVIGTRNLQASLSANHKVVKNADILTHTLWIRNNGNVEEKDLVITKTMASALSMTESEYHAANGAVSIITASQVLTADGAIRIPSLPAGASFKLVFNYTVKADDIGKRLSERMQVSRAAGNVVTDTVTVDTTGLSVSGRLTDQAGGFGPKDTVKFTVTVTNIGTVDVTGITLGVAKSRFLTGTTKVDPENRGLTARIGTLAPNASASRSYTYVVQEADLLATGTRNGVFQVTARGTYLDNEKEETVTGSVQMRATIAKGNPEVTVKMTASPEENLVADNKITYTVTVTNTGDMPVASITVKSVMEDNRQALLDKVTITKSWQGTSQMKTASSDNGNVTITNMRPSEEVRIVYTYTVTDSDITAGKDIKNKVVVTPSVGTEVTAEATSKLGTPKLTLKVTTTSTAKNVTNGYTKGETIKYQIVIKNEGSATVSGITATGAFNGATATTLLSGLKLDPGKEYTFYTSHTVTGDDETRKKVTYVVTAKGKEAAATNQTVETKCAVAVATATPRATATATPRATATPTANARATATATPTATARSTARSNSGGTSGSTPTPTPTATAAGSSSGGGRTSSSTPTPAPSMTPAGAAEPSFYTIMVRYLDSDGRPVLESFVGQYLKDETYYIVSPAIPGYQANIKIIQGTVSQNATYDVTYTPRQQSLQIDYLFIDGSQAAAEESRQITTGENYNIQVPEIEGYTAIIQTTEGVMPGHDMKVVVIYVPEDQQALIPGASTGIEGIEFVTNNAGECFE